ncbi:RBBP9/YdeN family alpha/beta hydrolase [Xenorhabdus lircayensis]|uniref:Alpha/beta hydrolase n=1 Tax=Xenorhabdus lircayensis TaxID=2763499 RepID=A0ABS0U0Z6_9GAMM|nr:alpha/beta hydrolase [Xenorhabdus lircayensis]MBI6547546.1 alpha/beta hydrolase [Xenorhabdus lircayensis]
MSITYLIVPGYTNSGPEHWQSYMERKYSNVVRVQQENWNSPVRNAWVNNLNKTIENTQGDLFLIGHSCGAVTIAQWSFQHENSRVKGALLVAPADVDAEDTIPEIKVQRPLPLLKQLPFPATMICSDNDKYLSLEKAHLLARIWGTSLKIIRGAGHLNTAVGYGEWEEGEKLINELSGGNLVVR